MVKSTRKSKSCRESHISVGVNVETNCPPEMTSKVKAALEQKIANFKSKKAKKARDAAEWSAKGGPSVNAYTNWVDNHNGEEEVDANPDVLSDEESINLIPHQKTNEEVRLLKEVRHLFSARELQAWNMVMAHGMSHQEAADLLCVSLKAFESYLKRAHSKFMNFMEEKKNERKD